MQKTYQLMQTDLLRRTALCSALMIAVFVVIGLSFAGMFVCIGVPAAKSGILMPCAIAVSVSFAALLVLMDRKFQYECCATE